MLTSALTFSQGVPLAGTSTSFWCASLLRLLALRCVSVVVRTWGREDGSQNVRCGSRAGAELGAHRERGNEYNRRRACPCKAPARAVVHTSS